MSELFKKHKEKEHKESTTVISEIEYKGAKAKIIHTIFLVILLILSAVCFLPLIWLFLSSFKDTKEFLQVPPSFLPEKFDFGKLADVWGKVRFTRTFFNTIFMAAGDILFCVVLNGLAGYVLSRLKPRGSRLVFMVVVWTMLLPHSTSTVPLFMTFTDFPIIHANLSNTYLPMWFIAGANCYYVLLFKSYFDSLSITYFEAARIDGCSNLRMFFKIVLPLSIPIIAVIIIFQFNASWGNFFWPFLLINNTNMTVLGVRLYQMKSGAAIDEYVAVMMFTVIPPAILYCIFQKQIMGGINLGGVKG